MGDGFLNIPPLKLKAIFQATTFLCWCFIKTLNVIWYNAWLLAQCRILRLVTLKNLFQFVLLLIKHNSAFMFFHGLYFYITCQLYIFHISKSDKEKTITLFGDCDLNMPRQVKSYVVGVYASHFARFFVFNETGHNILFA